MSGSPKYNCYRLQREQEKRLRAERQAQARAEAEQRHREVAMRQATRLLHAQSIVAADFDALESRLHGTPADVMSFLPGAGAAVRNRMRELREALARCSWEGEAWELRDRIRALRQDFGREVSDAARVQAREAAKRMQEEQARQLSRADAECRSAAARIAEYDNAKERVFDALGRSEVEQVLVATQSAIVEHDAPTATELAERLAVVIEDHEKKREAERVRWVAACAGARLKVALIDEALSGLKADQVVMRWCQNRIDEWIARLVTIEAALAGDRFGEVQIAADEWKPFAESILNEAQEMQLREDRRQYVVRSLCEVLAGQGFVLKNGSPALDYPEYPNSAVMIQARRLSGEALAISVPHDLDERVEYDLDGYERRPHTAADGTPATSCDAAELVIEQMRTVLDGQFGIESSPLEWEGKDPDRIRKGSKDLPGGGDEHRGRGGAA
ncbi:MAG: hypothetical protein ABJF10_13950 [Chthoniobacter sp.]|uniref:hypothetical protein n=1 Tax=Chthoniobacter sp. TaxID=2510640 RepID=UPI0032A89044